MSSIPPPEDDPTLLRTRNGAGAPKLHPSGAVPGGNALPLGTRLGEFEVTGLVGEGGFGIVYLAYDRSLARRVALKEYMPSSLAARSGVTVSVRLERDTEAFEAGRRSFVNEAHLLALFDHPALVKVYRFWEANGTAYMVMPYYQGLTLKETLKNLGGPPDEQWLKDLLRPLLDALELIHRKQCLHRDIAPDNILILEDGRPLLLDFGAARRVIGDLTRALTVILKPGYAPVEQYAAVATMKQGPWTDIYALASVVYYAITGNAPTPSVGRVMSDPLEPLAKIAAGRYDERFLRAIDRALSVKPEDRPQDVAQLRALLGLGERRQRPRASHPKVAPPAPATTTGDESTRVAGARPVAGKPARLALYSVGAASLLLAIAAGVVFLARPRQPEPAKSALPVPVAVPEPARAGPAVPVEAPRRDAVPVMTAPKTQAVPVPAPNDAGAAVETPRPRTAPVVTAPKTEATRAPVKTAPKPRTGPAGCSDILQRASLGETLTAEERSTLERDCR
jgi:hypothetical protein